MPQRQWIITNRTVGRVKEGRNFVERVTDTSREPLPVFRIGVFDPDRITARSNAAQIQRSVDIIEDEFVEHYDRLPLDPKTKNNDDVLEGLKGTRRLFAELYRDMCDSPAHKGDTLFFIHGFNYSFPEAMRHFRRLHDLYVKPADSPIARIVYFTWPSNGRVTHYPSDRAIAGPSGWLLGRLFAKVAWFFHDVFEASGSGKTPHCGRKIHLAAHSMGGQVLREFIRAIDQDGIARPPLFGEILLLHADLEWTALEKGQPLHRLPEFCERVHVYNHRRDVALGISETTKNAEKRLGKHGPKDKERISSRTRIIDCTFRTSRDGIPQGDMFFGDIDNILGKGRAPVHEAAFRHWGYLYCRKQLTDMYAVFAGWSSSRIEREAKTRKHIEGPLFYLT